MTKIREVIDHLESFAPRVYQESYDNSGFLVGSKDWEVQGVLVSLDVTEEILDEAISKKCNLIVAHHPLIFKGLKQITEDHWIGRCVRKAVKHDISIYAIHTNLDNVLTNGVNGRISDRLGLVNTEVLSPKFTMLEFELLVPELLRSEVEAKISALSCNSVTTAEVDSIQQGRYFVVKGIAAPHQKGQILSEVAQFGLYPTFSETHLPDKNIGSGLIGELELPMTESDFLGLLKKQMNTEVIRHSGLLGKSISKVAICGGAGAFLLGTAIGRGADVFITGDFKYHEFFEANKKIVIADIGHYESEQFTINLLFDLLSQKFSTFALHYTKVITNPVNYY